MYIITQSSGYKLQEETINLCVVSTEEKAKEIISDLIKLKENVRVLTLKMNDYRLELNNQYSLPKLPPKPIMSEELKNLYANRNLDKDRFKTLQKEHISEIDNWKIEYEKINYVRTTIEHKIDLDIKRLEKEARRNEDYNLPSELVDLIFQSKDYEVLYDYDEVLFYE